MPLSRSFGPVNIDSYLSAILDNYASGVQDNIYNEMSFLYWMSQKDRKEEVDGGDQKVYTVRYAKNTTAKRYSHYGVLDPIPQDNMTQAAYPWRQYAAMIMISGLEKRNNKGRKTQLVNLATERADDAMQSLRDLIAQDLVVASGSVDSQAVESVDSLINTTNTVGGVSGTTYTWWQATVTAGGSFAARGLTDLMTSYLTTWQGKQVVDLLYSSKSEYRFYWTDLQPQNRYVDQKTLDAGFENLRFMGATWLADDYPTAGKIWGMNTSSMMWTAHEDANFAMSDAIQPLQQDAFGKQLIGQFIFSTKNRRRNFKITSIVA